MLSADPHWYEVLADGHWPDEAFRDPWVLADPAGAGWHMLITARSNTGPVDERGVIGHATSPDLRHWDLLPPLSEPGQGFGQLEVAQVEIIYGQPTLIFSCLDTEVSQNRRATGTTGGVWCASAESLLGPYDISNAVQLTDRSLYSGRLIQDRDTGEWQFLAFHHDDDDGTFIGEISDPQKVHVDGRTIALTDADVRAYR